MTITVETAERWHKIIGNAYDRLSLWGKIRANLGWIAFSSAVIAVDQQKQLQVATVALKAIAATPHGTQHCALAAMAQKALDEINEVP